MSSSVEGAGRRPVLIGGAWPPEVVERYPTVSAAAAKWQLDFATAVAAEWGVPVTCLSFLYPGAGGGSPPPRPERVGDVSILPVTRRGPFWGLAAYAWQMLREVWRLRGSASHVFCYNPLVWTAPWAYLLGRLAGAPVVLIVADFELTARGGARDHVRVFLERLLLARAERFLALSPELRAVVDSGARFAVFNGLADEVALSLPAPVYRGPLRFVYAGSLTADSGIGDFLEAARRLAREGAACEFHVFGRGTLPETDLAALQGVLHFHGFVSDRELNEYLGTGCVGVNPRRAAGGVNRFNAPYKLLYYLSRGVLTITTATEGTPPDLAEVCVRAEDGAEGIARAMREVLSLSAGEVSERAARGRERVRSTRSAAALGAVAGELVA